jgi:hypothetical protein
MFYPNKLDTMDIRSLEIMQEFLYEVIAWDGDYYLQDGFDVDNRPKTPIGCRVVFIGEGAPEPTRWIHSRYSLLLDWHNREVVVPAIEVDAQGACRFSEGVIAWYLDTRRLSEHDIRALIGKKLYRRFLDSQESQPFDVEEIAQMLHLTPGQVFNQARVMVQLGYAESKPSRGIWVSGMPLPPPLTQTQQLGGFRLSTEGHRWFAAGAPEETATRVPNVTVSVDVHVAVSNVIEAAQESEVDDATKERFELMMRRLEADLQKPDGQGNMQSVKDVLDVANNAKGLLGPAIQFMAQNWDKIDRLGGVIF